ncbi:MAG: polymer-forming cytoskeletal protein [Spirochaetales bacterium]
MSDLRIRSVEESELTTVLASDVDFEGEMSFDEPVLVKGTFRGTVNSESILYVGKDARMTATVHADVVSIQGQIKGDVHAASRVELFSSSQLNGSVTSPDLIMQSGALLNGTCKMSRSA